MVSLSSFYAISENDTQETFSDTHNILKNDLSTKDVKQDSENTHILNTSSFKEYVSDGKFNEKVSDGDTIDIQGKFDSPKFALNITKSVNIISSTNDAYIDLDTLSVGNSGDYKNGMFQISEGSAGTNITGITFHNTRIWVKNTQNIHIDNITVNCESGTGFGVGSFSIRGGSKNITVTNSYFRTIHNGGHSNVVVAGASNCLFENNTVFADAREGNVGNVFYLTTYGGSSNSNITIRNNTIRSVFPNSQGLAICMGLVLEGNGHLIENNRIDALAAVGPQWADADYGVRTDIDNVTFRNNYVTGGAKLIFNGSFYNNTIDSARFTDNIAYNNTIEKHVTILNNTIFENNTVKKIMVEGDNNTLNNNEVRSEEDYAVIISGKNNTLTNNMLLSKNAYGEDAISNSTEYVSVNNSEKLPKEFYITDENIVEYFDDYSEDFGYPDYYYYKAFLMKEDIFNDGDILIFNTSTPIEIYGPNYEDAANLILMSLNENFISAPLGSKVIVNNSIIPTVFYRTSNDALTLINSTVISTLQYRVPVVNIDSVVIEDYPLNNTYILHMYPAEMNYFCLFNDGGYLLDSVNSSSKVLVYTYDTRFEKRFEEMWLSMDDYNYCEDMYLNKPLNFIGVPTLGIIGSKIHLIEGSTGTTFTGITFNDDVIVESNNIIFINCTFNKNIELKDNMITLGGNIFNGKITLGSSNNTVFNNNHIYSEDTINVINTRNTLFENNTITTTAENSIVFDDDSSNNVVRNNVLVAASLVGDDSVDVGDNIVGDNTPSYDTQIIIDSNTQAYVDEDLEVTISVNDLNNSKPVSKGYVEVYYDGYLIDIKNLTGGTASVTIPVADYVDGSDSYPIKVWYYDGKRYANNITTKSITLIKSNVSITVDEFTAKLNEKATITATFLNSNGKPVQDTNITFTIGRLSYTVETVDGVATLDELVTKEWLDAGKITVSFPNTDVYNSNTTTITLNTSKDDVIVIPVVSVEDGVASIQLNLADSLNSPVSDGKVTITTLDGQELASGRVTNGVYTTTVTIPEDYTEEYLVANYAGSYYYNDFMRNVKITQMLNSTIALETNSPLYGEDLVITGTLRDSKNNPIEKEEVTVNTDGTKTTYITDAYGTFTHTYTPVLGVNNITVTFNGNSDVYGTSIEKTVTIRDTDRDMNEVLNQLEELQEENSKLQKQLEALQEQLNNQTTELTQQNEALITIINTLTDLINNQNEQIAALQDQIASLTALENTTITLEEITDAKYKSDVVISGSLVSRKGLALSGQTITITVNDDEPVNVVTVNGAFEYTAVFKSVGEQTVSVAYAGSEDYLGSDASATFYVGKQDVVVTVDSIADSAYGDNVTIAGKFTDVNGKAISNSNVRIFLNGKKYLARTDKTGAYSLSAKVTAMGENNVTVAYGGNDKYNEYENTITFNADKQDVIVTYNVIEDTKFGENVTIMGTFTDKNGKAIINSNVKITINGKKYYAKTDTTGAYTFTTRVTAVGINNVTVGYSGNDKYNAFEDITTFNAESQDVIVTVNPVEEVTVGENVIITGTFTDKYGKAITNSNVKIVVNGKKYYAKTDTTGAYTFTTTVTTEGINNITAGYGGSAKYNAYETSTTFIAKAE